MSLPAADPPPTALPARRSHLVVAGVAAYALLAIAASLGGKPWLAAIAVFVLGGAVLSPALRRGSPFAWIGWAVLAIMLGLLARRGEGALALDALPALVNTALCALFAHTLAHGRTPLIARFIAIIETPERLENPRIASYARHLTLAWALVLGAQALVLGAIFCGKPQGLLEALGFAPLAAFASAGWTLYLRVGGYALVPAFLALEYAYRRWHLDDVPHAPLPVFIAQLVRRWPALLQSLGDGNAR